MSIFQKFKTKKKQCLIIIAFFGLCFYLCDTIVQKSYQEYIYKDLSLVPQKNVALVLGTARTFRGRLNAYYFARLNAAAELFKQNKVRAIIVSGDNGRKGYNEPKEMKEDLIKMGVPAKYITCDYAGFRTLDSIHRIAKVFQENEYIIISQRFHIERALYIAKQQGHEAYAFEARQPKHFFSFRFRLREVLARTWMMLDIHLFETGPKYLGQYETVLKKPAFLSQK